MEPRITNPPIVSTPIYRVRGQKNWIYPDRRLNPEDCETLTNINITEEGTADKRNGYETYNSNQITEAAAAKAVVGLFSQTFTAAQTRNVVIAGTKGRGKRGWVISKGNYGIFRRKH